ncbi:unnamed protein product, partial [Phaeothamnion confervicola]
MVGWSGKRIKSLRLFREVNNDSFLPTRGFFSREHVPFLVLYAWALRWCFMTIGEQYHDALARAEEFGMELPGSIDRQRTTLNAMLAGVDITAKDADIGVKIASLPSEHLPGFWALLALGLVAIAHALMMLLQHWSVNMRCLIRFRPVDAVERATHVRVTPRTTSGSSKTLLLPVKAGPLGPWFVFNRRKYVHDPRKDAFVKIRCATDLPLAHFRAWHGLPSEAAVEHTLVKFGPNRFEMAAPGFLELYRQQILSPFTIFQLFCSGLWLLDNYWTYSVFTLFMIFTFEATVVFQRIKNLGTLKGMGNESHPVSVHRAGRWRPLTTDQLLPGDLFSLRRTKANDVVPCDCLLVRGSAVVNEASLTGESVPQMKEGLGPALRAGGGQEEALGMKASHHKVHVLYGGTKILTSNSQVSRKKRELAQVQADDEEEDGGAAPKGNANGHGDDGSSDEEEVEEIAVIDTSAPVEPPPDGGCLCYVLRTGFASSQGKLVRMIEGSTETVRTDTRDTALLLLLLLAFAVCSSGYVLHEGMKSGNKRSKYELLLHCVLIVTTVIPPELPMQMALAVNSSLMTLLRMQVFCTEPYRIPMAGKVDTCLFDKTGTLTTDELVAVGVAPAAGVAVSPAAGRSGRSSPRSSAAAGGDGAAAAGNSTAGGGANGGAYGGAAGG